MLERKKLKKFDMKSSSWLLDINKSELKEVNIRSIYHRIIEIEKLNRRSGFWLTFLIKVVSFLKTLKGFFQ